LSKALSEGFNSRVLLHLVVEYSTDLSLLGFVLESASSDLVVTASHVLEGCNSPVSLSLSKSVSKNIELDSLDFLRGVFSLVTLSIDVARNVVDFSLSLFDGSIKLHGVVSSVSQGLLEVSNLAGKFTLGGLVFGILFLDLRLVLELDGLFLKDGALHVFDHLFLFLAKLIVHELHTMDFFTHGNDFRLTDFGVNFFLHFLLKLDLTLPKEDLAFSFNDFSQDIGLLFLELGDLVLKLDALIFKLLKFLLEFVFNIEVIVSKSSLRGLVLSKDFIELTHLRLE